MKPSLKKNPRAFQPVFGALAAIALMCGVPDTHAEVVPGLYIIGEFPAPGLESELSGISPHPSDESLYFVVANRNPTYKAGQKPKLQETHRGRLLTIQRDTGKVVKSLEIVGGDYGGMAFAQGHLFISSLNPPEVLKVVPDTGEIVKRIPLASPAGGLAYDEDRGVLIAQLFVGSPGLAVIELESGATTQMLWSDENAMGLSKVGPMWLCTWASGFDPHAFGELRRLSPQTGRVTGRIPLDAVHFATAPLTREIGGGKGFMSMRAVDRTSGEVSIRYYGFDERKVSWAN